MQESRIADSRPRMPARESTAISAAFSQVTPTVVQGKDEKPENYRNMAFEWFIGAMGLPSTIGTAMAVGGAFTVLSADSILGDNSPESLAHRREMVTFLTWSAGFYAFATGLNVSLQALYGSPSFRQILHKTLDSEPEDRAKFEPLSWLDFARYTIAYLAVLLAFLTIAMHFVASMLLIQTFAAYGPTLVTQIICSLFFAMLTAMWAVSIAVEQPRVRERWGRVFRLQWLPTKKQAMWLPTNPAEKASGVSPPQGKEAST